MSVNNDITFQEAVEWADSIENRKKDRKRGINILYLILGAVIVIVLMILIIYLVGREPEESVSALTLMQDETLNDTGLLDDNLPAGTIVEDYNPDTGETVQYEYVEEYVDTPNEDLHEQNYEYVESIPNADNNPVV